MTRLENNRNTGANWGVVSRAFHWAIVVLILFQAVTGLGREFLPRASMGLHKSIGITILALAVLRLFWRLYAGRPADLPSMARLQAWAAHAGHWLLYGLMFAVPLTGWGLVSAGGRALAWFGLPVPAITTPNEALHEQLEGLHEQLFWVLAAVALGHAAVALWHHFVDKDDTLRRMVGRAGVTATK